jgi:hypothetical protein
MNSHAKSFHPALLLLLFCLRPGIAMANSGAPLIAGFGFDLLKWSLGLGLFEALFVWLFYKCHPAVSVLLLFFGNLISGWFGLTVFSHDYHFQWLTIYNFDWIPYALWFAAYIFSVLLEYPAYRLAMYYSKIDTHRLARSIQACLVIHLPFYLIMGGGFLFSTEHYSVNGYEKVRDLSFMTDSRTWIYYISRPCDRVLRCRPDGTGEQAVLKLPQTINPDTSFLWLEEGRTTSTLDLHLVGQGDWKLREGFATRKQWQPADKALAQPEIFAQLREKDSMDTFLPMLCADFRKPNRANLFFYTTTPWQLLADKPNVQKMPRVQDRVRVLQSPLASWKLRNLTVLPNDRLIFALGDQICVLDYPTRRLGLITHGYRPLVVKESVDLN